MGSGKFKDFSGTTAGALECRRKRPLTEEDFTAVNKAKAIIDERLSASPKISELALLTNTSAAKLQNDFQLAFGSTIHGYVIKARMQEALHRLDSTDEQIYVIAESVGCKNPSRFAELFKKTYGLTPMAYRALKKGPADRYRPADESHKING